VADRSTNTIVLLLVGLGSLTGQIIAFLTHALHCWITPTLGRNACGAVTYALQESTRLWIVQYEEDGPVCVLLVLCTK
jgi:hypothetical protein